jgi:hypothetical protein
MAQHPHPLSSHRGPVTQVSQNQGNLPEVFAAAVGGIAELRPRAGLEFEPLPAPRRLAAYSHALSVTAAEQRAEGEIELGSGRFVLLYEPEGHEEWQGSWRCVTLLQAELEPEMAEDPLLADVTWTWLREALSGLGCTALGGTVSRCASSGFGELADQGTSTSVELRASWSPLPPVDENAPGGGLAGAGVDRIGRARRCVDAVPGDGRRPAAGAGRGRPAAAPRRLTGAARSPRTLPHLRRSPDRSLVQRPHPWTSRDRITGCRLVQTGVHPELVNPR